MQITDIFRARLWMCGRRPAGKVTGNESKVNKFVALMDNFGVLDLRAQAEVACRVLNFIYR